MSITVWIAGFGCLQYLKHRAFNEAQPSLERWIDHFTAVVCLVFSSAMDF
jgi:hypothetical protein